MTNYTDNSQTKITRGAFMKIFNNRVYEGSKLDREAGKAYLASQEPQPSAKQLDKVRDGFMKAVDNIFPGKKGATAMPAAALLDKLYDVRENHYAATCIDAVVNQIPALSRAQEKKYALKAPSQEEFDALPAAARANPASGWRNA